MSQKNNLEPKALKTSLFYFLVTLIFHIILYCVFWNMDPIWRKESGAGTAFMRVGALASVLILTIDILLIKYLNSKAKKLAIKPSDNEKNYMWYQNLANSVTWQGALFVLVNTLIWGFGDWIYIL
jgi:hypothetical protein